ncbi:hypothetical protein JYU34_000811 [Plutella xylostella]|uniref:Uncharacterized protein n=1 Tax=Plutella xylostella TaxID=51655 RepID=A0ABQ7R8L3_PLUXY|nr:hypothetical protein JYU34_000811 [Plutella xylostella]
MWGGAKRPPRVERRAARGACGRGGARVGAAAHWPRSLPAVTHCDHHAACACATYYICSLHSRDDVIILCG